MLIITVINTSIIVKESVHVNRGCLNISIKDVVNSLLILLVSKVEEFLNKSFRDRRISSLEVCVDALGCLRCITSIIKRHAINRYIVTDF